LSTAAAFFLAFPFFLLSPVMGAAEPSLSSVEYIDSEYLVETWQTEQGLPDNFVNTVAQTPDGYLWVGTFNGLARFNGLEFVFFDAANTPELPSDGIRDLYVDRNGRLWIKSERGDLSLWKEGRFSCFVNQLPKVGIGPLAEDHEGNIWASSYYDSTNYFQLVEGMFRPATGSSTFFERFGTAVDREGYGWGIQGNVLFSTHAPDCRATVPGMHPGQGWRLTAARDGAIWVIGGRIQKFHPPSRAVAGFAVAASSSSDSITAAPGYFEDFGPLPVATDQFEGYLEDSSGNLWVGTGVGELWRIGTNHTFKRFRFRDSTSLELGRGIFEDAEGNLWIGNGGDGLARIRPRALRTFDSNDGLASDVVRSVAEDGEGNIWLATVNRVDWFREGANRAEPRGVRMSLPWDLFRSTDGAVWIASLGQGLLRISGQNETWFNQPGREIAPPELNVLFEDRQGQMLFGSREGLYGIERGHLIHSPMPEGLPTVDIRSIAESPTGDLYLGLNGGGLLRRTKEGWQHYTARDGLAENHVWALYADADAALWIGTHGRGLSRLKDGRFFTFSKTPDGRVLELELPPIINSIIEDDSGHLWLGSNQGLFRVARQQLNELAEGRSASLGVTHYDRANGMGSSQCTGARQPTVWKARDGKLWFATMKGVIVVEPRSLPFNTRPPPVVVEAVLIDDAVRPMVGAASVLDGRKSAGTSVIVPPGVHRLELRYAGLSFTAPERVRFRYRLEGFEKDWVNAGARRAAYYTKVPPGSYHFHVLACNNDNVWNQTGASIGVLVEPLFWQTAWFRVAAVLCAVGFGIWLYELRVLGLKRRRAVQESFSRKLIESQENERKRIAAELHDGLGQSLLVVKNYATIALKEPTIPEKTHKQLQEISEGASASIEEVRSIARALRPYQLDRFGLTKTLEDAAELAAHSGHLEVTTTVENIDGMFSPEAEISIYRIVQEWLNNVVKHSGAKRARLLVRKDAGIMRMILEDDGSGFIYDAVMKRAAAGFGLANLSERARLLGGSLKLETAPGKGTRLLVELPCKK
jgi:signal transduction histidine kinase/ligand-binding sensor domain-containing protein